MFYEFYGICHTIETAYHEAGHVVASFLLDVEPAVMATIVPDEYRLGKTRQLLNPYSSPNYFEDAIYVLAGPVAAILINEGPVPEDMTESDEWWEPIDSDAVSEEDGGEPGEDYQSALECAGMVYPTGTDRGGTSLRGLLDLLTPEAATMLRANWDKVETVALMLLERGTVEKEDLYPLFPPE